MRIFQFAFETKMHTISLSLRRRRHHVQSAIRTRIKAFDPCIQNIAPETHLSETKSVNTEINNKMNFALSTEHDSFVSFDRVFETFSTHPLPQTAENSFYMTFPESLSSIFEHSSLKHFIPKVSTYMYLYVLEACNNCQ